MEDSFNAWIFRREEALFIVLSKAGVKLDILEFGRLE
jgi:hypothetical protein